MSSDATFSTSDLRSHAQDYKRDAAHKHKWALGPKEDSLGAPGKLRPARPSRYRDHYQRSGSAVNIMTGAASIAGTTRMPRKYDTTLDTADESSLSAGSASDDFDDDEPARHAVPGVMYSFDRPVGPSQGSQILTLALSKAVERFEERETAKLVHSEYDVLDSEGETVPFAPGLDKKRRHKHKLGVASSSVAAVTDGAWDADDDYEFV